MTAQALIQSISEFANTNSNPVLSVLPENGEVEYDHKYPEPVLSFSDAGVRAYYHCHSWSSPPDGEHGHFHIFVRAADKTWTHVAGLSMDSDGQPIQWFTVNHWVTGESWKEPLEITDALEAVSEDGDWLLTEKWLWQMLKFYFSTLKTLLIDRDAAVSKLILSMKKDELFQERKIYILSRHDIDLLKDITSSTEDVVIA